MLYLSADVGGTFTDLVLSDEESGALYLDKLSSTPGSADAVIEGIARICTAAGVSPGNIDIFVHGFTVGTNAFLTRKGARTAMAVSAGTRDVLEIGDQVRPHLYRLQQSKPPPLVPRSRIVEVHERRDAFGKVITALTEEEAARVAAAIAAFEPQAVAVCLSFSHLDGAHEELLRDALAASLPDCPIYLSSDINPQISEYPRAATTAVAAHVGPVVDRYVATLDQALADAGLDAPLLLMKSDGGVATPQAARDNPATMLLSGPAGGVIAGAAVSAATDQKDLVTFDMGGTSADFSLIVNGEPRTVTEREVDGQPLRLATLDIETISAGGGSIASVDLGGALKVGPDSAGAVPGPACYGRGGEAPTVTDAAVVLGIIGANELLGGEMPLQPELARAAVEEQVAWPLDLSLEQAALGIIRVACASMNQAIRRLSVERGLDIRDFALMAFGGAGPIYAPFMAKDLEMKTVLVPISPGVCAAHGLLMSDIRHTTQAAWGRRFSKVEEAELTARLRALAGELSAALDRDGIAEEDRYFRYSADLRCVGQFHELQVPLEAPAGEAWWRAEAQAERFHAIHKTVYGHTDATVPVEFVNLRVEAFGRTAKAGLPLIDAKSEGPPEEVSRRPIFLDPEHGFVETPIYRRSQLLPGHRFEGPAVVTQRDSTTVLLPDQTAVVTDTGILSINIAKPTGGL